MGNWVYARRKMVNNYIIRIELIFNVQFIVLNNYLVNVTVSFCLELICVAYLLLPFFLLQ